MSQKIRIVIVGWQPKLAHLPNLSQHCARAIAAAPDAELVAIVSRNPKRVMEDIKGRADLPEGLKVLGYDEIGDLNGKVDAALLAVPTEHVGETATAFLEQGICTADSFDDHHLIIGYRQELDKVAKDHKAVAVIASGWEPGLLSSIRALVESSIPEARMATTYGGKKGGRSLGHSAMARETIRKFLPETDALSITYASSKPSHHDRLVAYIDPEGDKRKEEVFKALRATDKFKPKDPCEQLTIIAVKDKNELEKYDTNHHSCEVLCQSETLKVEFNLDLDGPEVTANNMLAGARAAVRRAKQRCFGTFTQPEIAPIEMLPGETFEERVKQNKSAMV